MRRLERGWRAGRPKERPRRARGLSLQTDAGTKFVSSRPLRLSTVGGCGLKSLPKGSDIIFDMRTISVAVSEKNYELFRQRAHAEDRSIASLIRDAMAEYLRPTAPARTLSGEGAEVAKELLPGPGRYRIYAEVTEAD